jgi:hypothetical protein
MLDFDICSFTVYLFLAALLFAVPYGIYLANSGKDYDVCSRGSSGPGPMYYFRDDYD